MLLLADCLLLQSVPLLKATGVESTAVGPGLLLEVKLK